VLFVDLIFDLMGACVGVRLCAEGCESGFRGCVVVVSVCDLAHQPTLTVNIGSGSMEGDEEQDLMGACVGVRLWVEGCDSGFRGCLCVVSVCVCVLFWRGHTSRERDLAHQPTLTVNIGSGSMEGDEEPQAKKRRKTSPYVEDMKMVTLYLRSADGTTMFELGEQSLMVRVPCHHTRTPHPNTTNRSCSPLL
jgi:hypothetical protein